MTRIKGQLTTADYLSMDAFRKLVEALEKDRKYLWVTYCWLSFCTAFRASDVRSLRWKDVLDRSQIVKMEKKTGKSRRVKFNQCVREKIRNLYELQGRPDADRLIFMNPKTGNPYSLEHINRLLKGWRVKYRIPVRAFSTHSFRKTFGRYVYETNDSKAEGLVLLNEIFRHPKLETTRRYIGLVQEDIDNVFDSIRL